MDEKWRDWYECTLLPLLKHSPGDEPSSELKRLLARDPTGVDLALLSADTDRIQEYVFESSKLPEIRGGSELLRRFNEEDLVRLLAETGLPGGFVDAPTPGCLVYAGGGSFLAMVPASVAEGLAARIEHYYPTETGKATITCVWRPVSAGEILYGWGGETVSLEMVNALRPPKLTVEHWQRIGRVYGVKDGSPIPAEAFGQKRGFGQMVQVMGNLLRQRKDCPPLKPIIEALPFAMRCQVCQVRPAGRIYLYLGEQWPVCDVCRHKLTGGAREARSRQVDRFLEWLRKERPDLEARYLDGASLAQIRYAQDLGDLGEASLARMGYIGFIYADGNRMGQALVSLPTLLAYRRFSQALHNAVEMAAYQTLAENLRPAQRGFIHPLEPLIIGGDDVMLIVPGDAALPVAARLCQLFEREMRRQVPDDVWAVLPSDFQHPTISVGVVIADSHNPVRVLQQVAKELCKSAKRRAHDEEQAESPTYTSTLDFLLLKSQSMLRRSVKQLRHTPPYYFADDGRGKRGRYLTATPYTLDECCRLLRLLKLMRQVDFPTSQLQGLVAGLQRGRQYGSIHYLYQLARLKARLGEGRKEENVLARLPEIWSYDDRQDPIPWHRVPGEEGEVFASILPDLLELYPFVPKPAAVDLWQEILTEAGHDNQN